MGLVWGAQGYEKGEWGGVMAALSLCLPAADVMLLLRVAQRRRPHQG